MARRMRGTLLALVPVALMASLACVADGSLSHATARAAGAASTGPPTPNSAWTRRRQLSPSGLGVHNEELLSLDKVMRLRGGVKRAAVKAEEDEDDAEEDGEVAEGSGAVSALTGVFANYAMEVARIVFFQKMPPATRVYVLLLLLITAVDVSVGKVIDSSNTFALDWGKTIKGLNLWRPLTSLVYLGPLSMSWLTNVYFLTQHGTRLELVSGTAEQVIFLLVVGSLLLMLGPLIGMPFLSTPMVAAHTYVSARMDPLGQVQFQFLRIPMWTLPFAQMGAAVLQEEGQPMAAIPHLVGILCGHVYHFFTVVHPLMGAKRRLGAPAWMKRRLDGGDNPNFMESSGDDDPPAPRGRKIGAGKKKASKAPRDTKRSAKKEQTKARPVPEFPTSSGCS